MTEKERVARGVKAGRVFYPLLGATILLGHLVTLSPGLVTLSGAEPEAPVFLLQTASGAAASGPLLELAESWRVRLGGSKPVRTEAGDLIELRQAGKPLPALPDGEQLILVNGDRVPGVGLRLAGERVLFRPRLSGQGGDEKEMALPVSALAVIWLAAPDGVDHPDLLRRRLAAGKRARDLVHLRSGDVVEGVLAGLDDKMVQVEVDKQVIDIRRDRVAAVALNTELAALLRPKGAYGRLVLANGGRLSLASAACADGKTLNGETLFQAPVRVPLDEVAALYVYQGRAVYLSDLKPARAEHTPYLPTALPGSPVTDGSFAGFDLRVGGSTHDKGLGLHSACRLTYDLAGGYRRFEALVGLDDRTGRQGSVRVGVLVDGKELWHRELTARGGPAPVRLDVAGAKELTLAVEFGRGGDVQDHVDWLDARLVK